MRYMRHLESKGIYTMATKKAAQKRTVTILVRYFIKKGANAGNVVLLVRNDRGEQYYVTLRRSGQHSCSCPHVPSAKCPTCYHINDCRTVENARRAALRQASQPAPDTAEINEILAEIDAAKSAQPVAQPVDIAERGKFHSARAFSLAR